MSAALKNAFIDLFSSEGRQHLYWKFYRRFFAKKYQLTNFPPIPFSCLEFLLNNNLKNSEVFEWSSNLHFFRFWAANVAKLVSMDTNSATFEQKKTLQFSNTTIFLEPNPFENLLKSKAHLASPQFVLLDGKWNFDSALLCSQGLGSDSFLILKNPEAYPKLCEELGKRGYSRIDFEGPEPLTLTRTIASVFTKQRIQPPEKSISFNFSIASSDYSLVSAQFLQEAFSQEGEDILLDQLIGTKKSGTFVDVGAHHPFRFSNTYRLYQRGWRGLNIDPNPEIREQFQTFRPEDQAWVGAASNKQEEATFYRFNEPALNTLNSQRAQELIETSSYKLLEKAQIEAKPLTQILKEFQIPKNFEFLNIDVEGFEKQVLEGLDFQEFQPEIIFVEALPNSQQNGEDFVLETLTRNGYQKVAQLSRTHAFMKTHGN